MASKELINPCSELVIYKEANKEAINNFFIKGDYVSDVIKQMKDEALKHDPDVSTKKGRDAITANITIHKNKRIHLEKTGKNLSAEFKGIPLKIDKTRNELNATFIAFEIKLRKPLTDWEDEQKVIAAKKAEQEAVEKLVAERESDYELAVLMDEKVNRDIEDARIKAEKEARELAEQKERDRIKHEDQLKQEAATSARLEAEQKAKDKTDRIEQERQDAIDLAAKLKQEVIDAENKAKQDKINAADLVILNDAHNDNNIFDAEKRRIKQNNDARIAAAKAETLRLQQIEDAKAAAKIEAKRAEIKRLADIESARLTEVKRQQVEQATIKREKQVREANQKYRGGVHRAILEVLLAHKFTEEQSKLFIKLAASNCLPKLTINY